MSPETLKATEQEPSVDNKADEQYLNLVKRILDHGVEKTDPQTIGNIAVFGHQMRFDLDDGFPLNTTRSLRGSWNAMTAELTWFLSGSTNVADLHEQGVHIWDQWATENISTPLGLETGDLGPVYGKQWRAFNGGGPEPVDQISRLIGGLKEYPDSRRHIVTSWNPAEVDQVFVAPCHCFFQFFHAQGEISLHVYQRSADVPIGLPFNTAEYALLLKMVAQVTGYKAKELIHTLADAHIYLDQVSHMEELIKREPMRPPDVSINPEIRDIFQFKPEDFKLQNYKSHPSMSIPVGL